MVLSISPFVDAYYVAVLSTAVEPISIEMVSVTRVLGIEWYSSARVSPGCAMPVEWQCRPSGLTAPTLAGPGRQRQSFRATAVQYGRTGQQVTAKKERKQAEQHAADGSPLLVLVTDSTILGLVYRACARHASTSLASPA